MATDVFPQATTIVRRLMGGADQTRGELLRYLMSLYAHPLRVYFLGCSYRSLAEPDEIVNGYFTSYLVRPGYLEKWQGSQKRLRHWLANGLLFYCRDRLKEQRRSRGEPLGDTDPISPPADAQRAFEVEVKCQGVRLALDHAREQCERRGLSQHWDMFEDHYVRSVPMNALASQAGVSAERARVMVRTGERAFAKAARAIIAADIDSDHPDDIDRELSE